jgi:polyisoprenoid-binding protein YceI
MMQKKSTLAAHAVALIAAIAAVAAIATAPAFAATTYTIDKNHTDLSFQIRHMVSQVRGEFRDFSGKIVKDDANPAASSVELTIQAASIETGVDSRDNDLRSENFFDVAKFPSITFKSTKVEKVSDNEYKVTGDFTMHGVTKVITLPVTFDGEIKEGPGKSRAGFSTSTVLDRKEFGIVWNKALDGGGMLLSDEVKVGISVSAKQSS